jgi:hypothetical protein
MKLFKFDSDASSFEKNATYACAAFGVIVLFILFGSVWGLLDNQLSAASSTATGWWDLLGTIFFFATGGFVLCIVKDWFPRPVNPIIKAFALLVLASLSICFYCGFFVAA